MASDAAEVVTRVLVGCHYADEQCHVQNPQSSPYSVSMMTGLYPHCAGYRTLLAPDKAS